MPEHAPRSILRDPTIPPPFTEPPSLIPKGMTMPCCPASEGSCDDWVKAWAGESDGPSVVGAIPMFGPLIEQGVHKSSWADVLNKTGLRVVAVAKGESPSDAQQDVLDRLRADADGVTELWRQEVSKELEEITGSMLEADKLQKNYTDIKAALATDPLKEDIIMLAINVAALVVVTVFIVFWYR